jgi:hypothetical protein
VHEYDRVEKKSDYAKICLPIDCRISRGINQDDALKNKINCDEFIDMD